MLSNGVNASLCDAYCLVGRWLQTIGVQRHAKTRLKAAKVGQRELSTGKSPFSPFFL